MNTDTIFSILVVCLQTCLHTLAFPGQDACSECDITGDDQRFDCHPEKYASQEACIERGCCWREQTGSQMNVPSCYYPSSYTGYEVDGIQRAPSGVTVRLQRKVPSGIDADVQTVSVEVVFHAPEVARVTIQDPLHARFVPPVPEIQQGSYADDLQYGVDVTCQGDLNIYRLDALRTPIFRTQLNRLVFTDQLLQLPLILPSKRMYGLGEHYAPLMLPTNWSSYYFFNNGLEPEPNKNLYGTHPIYICLEDGGTAHGVFLRNSNAMEVLLQPTPAAVFRALGGIFDFFVFVGSSPAAVVRQYKSVVGMPAMPPYWALGFHLCRYNYGSLDRTRETMLNNIRVGIPLDVQWNDIDHMVQRNGFTYDHVNYAGLPQFVDQLHAQGRHYVLIFDAAVSGSQPPGTYPPYDDGIAMDIFVRNSSGDISYTKVWNPISSVFPDFSHPNATSYWTKQFQLFHDKIPFDGAWLDMNEPFVFERLYPCPLHSKLEYPPYVPSNEPLHNMTLCMTDKHYISSHYNVHNAHTYLESVSTYHALKVIRRKRPFIISRATFSGQGKWAGHWTGDTDSAWEDMRATIPAMLNFGIYGIPLVGADICGFHRNTTVELCARWHALGSFYPFARNHNDKDTIDQDPFSMGPTVIQAARKNLLNRYSLLPYLYTLFYGSRAFGDTVARAMFFEFPHDPKTYEIESQFMWGSALLIMPALYPVSAVLPRGQKYVRAYVPGGVWYNLYSGAPIDNEVGSRAKPLTLLVALDKGGTAQGQLFWDDGESLDTLEKGEYSLFDFVLAQGRLEVIYKHSGYVAGLYLAEINVAGIVTAPLNVTAAGETVGFKYDTDNKLLRITLQCGTEMNRHFDVWWS
ncbi:lysosomal alpha-glucosidase-like [Ornithodoros turicata]|uniref:lysosomal alpha-glucosidase-like n=1 Tax=Ornithodoros turicata TaxID=34597 RepID=UPI00313A180B